MKKKPKPPCTQHCESRSNSCHTHCKVYLEYEEAYRQWQEQQDKLRGSWSAGRYHVW